MSAAPARTAYRIHLEYDGTRYKGWQRQGEAQAAAGIKTISGTVERILAQAGLRPLAWKGSGRTDAGVHALDQVAHLHLARAGAPTPHRLHLLLNEALPTDIQVTRVQPCATAFHARHSACARTYRYHLCLRRTAFAKPWVWWVKAPLDLWLLGRALERFQGFHDMKAFSDVEPEEESRCEIQRCRLLEEGALRILEVRASHFLRRQVRRMVGAVVACASGQATLDELMQDLERPTEAAQLRWAERAAPAAGLFLVQVHYPGEDAPLPPPWFKVP